MNKYQQTNRSVTIFNQLTRKYLLAISVIAIIILLSQWLIQGYLDKQLNDSRVINVAGRQRMLSQQIAKQVLQLRYPGEDAQIQKISKELRNTLLIWKEAHQGLKNGNEELGLPGKNSEIIQSMFFKIEQPFQKIVEAGDSIINQLTSAPSSEQVRPLDKWIQQIITYEEAFLFGMDAIVFQYDQEAKNKVVSLRSIEFFLLLIALVALLLELLFIFRPTAHFVKNNVEQLMEAEREAKNKAEELNQLYQEKERSVQELKALNYAVDKAALFASTTLDGKVIYLSDKLTKFLGYNNGKPFGQFPEVLTQNEGEQQYIAQILKTPRSAMWTGEVPITTLKGKKCWLELSIVPVNRSGVKQDYLILCSDITARKDTELELKRISQEHLDEEIRLQKVRSSQVVEAQEKERERIAKDMHDGIGQMLTALKFNLESLNLKKPEKLEQKIAGLKSLSTNLIKGVRIATFNLTPPELTDYGISTALAKLCKELSRLTGQNVLFENKTQFQQRFDSVVETNIYRIIQEAVNNAIKYAEANYILVTLSQSENLLSLMVDDDGKGFDTQKLEQKSPSENSAHMGLAFMQERVKFINGRLFIRSNKGEGTRITVNIPIDNTPHSK